MAGRLKTDPTVIESICSVTRGTALDRCVLAVVRAVGFLAGAVGDVGNGAGAVLQPFQRFGRLFQQLFLPGRQLAAEIFQLPLVHERFVFGRTVIVWKKDLRLHLHFLLGPGPVTKSCPLFRPSGASPY